MLELSSNTQCKKYRQVLKEYQEFFRSKINEYAIFKTDDIWIRVTRERPVRIKGVYDNFVRFAVVNYKGHELYYECCNYSSLYEGEDQFVFV